MFKQNRTLRAAALLAVIAVGVDTPKGCANQDKGPGEQENVKPIAEATAPPRGHSAQPGNAAKHDRKRKVTLKAIWSPKREVSISWKIGGHYKPPFSWYGSPWERTQDTYSGDRVELTVENHGVGGFTACSIMIDGVNLRTLVEDDKNQPYVHRNDAGDCKVWVIVP